MDGILLIDKPKGISSFKAISILKKKLGVGKIGHSGTLDPLASGLLIVGIDGGTKKLKDFFGLPKVYLMDVLLGTKTETGDLEGRVIKRGETGNISKKNIIGVLKSLEGYVDFLIPRYSAVKFKGVPFYRYARKGIEPPERKRRSKIFYLKLLGVKKRKDDIILKVEMKCSSGTYARSVAEEIGERLNVPSTLYNLKRIKIGNFDIKDAKKLQLE